MHVSERRHCRLPIAVQPGRCGGPDRGGGPAGDQKLPSVHEEQMLQQRPEQALP